MSIYYVNAYDIRYSNDYAIAYIDNDIDNLYPIEIQRMTMILMMILITHT